jgi:hypothetical protein
MVQPNTKRREMQGLKARRVVVLYETPVVREHALRFCEWLSREQGAGQESPEASEVGWWSFQLLGDPTLASDAALKAAAAEVVIFAMHAQGDLSDEIKWWIEAWLNKRGEREGALVGLLVREETSHSMAPFREIYLRNIALRAGMDYLSHAAPTVPKAIPDSLDSFNQRAGQMTSVLDKILHTRPHSPPML